MPNIRVRFKLNPGREGIAFSKLAKHAEAIENLLHSVAKDIGLLPEQNEWLGKDFKNGSVFSTAENQALVDVEQKEQFNYIFKELIKFKPKKNGDLPVGVTLQTLENFSNLKTPLEIDETIGIGLYDEGKNSPKFYKVTKLKLEEIAKCIDAETSYVGAVIGYTYEWTKGAKEPFIKIRDIASGELIKCIYDDKDYKKVAKLFDIKDALVVIYGSITFNKLTEKTEVIKASDFEISPSLDQSQYENFFGSAQGFTGGIDAASYIRKLRSGE